MAVSFCLLTAIVVALTALAIMFGVPFTSGTGYYGEQRSEVFNNLGLVADLKKERLLLWLEERKGDAEVLSKSRTLRSFIQATRKLERRGVSLQRRPERIREIPGYTAARERLLRTVGAYKVYQEIQVADASTGVILASTDAKHVGIPASADPAFAGALRAVNRAWIEILGSRSNGEARLVVSRALSEGSESADTGKLPLGVILMRIDPDQFVKPLLYTGGGLGETGDIVLVNQDWRILISPKCPLPDGTWARPLQHVIRAEPAILAASGHDGIIASRDCRNVPVLAAYRHIRVTPELTWGMVVKVDQSEVFESLRRNLLTSLLVGFLGVVAAIAFAVLISRRLSRPILELSRTAKKVKDGNLGVRAPVFSTDEVGSLASTFNEMVERVQQSHEELEEQVKARTKQLADLNEEFEARNAELERFTYTVSHDLSSPLITIKTFAGFVEQALHEGNPEAIGQDLERIKRAAEKMGRLLEELLELSRIGRLVNPFSEVPLAELVHEAVELLRGPILDRGAQVEIMEGLPTVPGDRPRLSEVFQNLLDNALKFMGDQPRPKVEIGVRQDGGERVFYFCDNGIGIDHDYQDRIFRLFDKLDRDSEGMGIGLALVKRIVEAHGGRIWVESGGHGQGSAFCFTLAGDQATTGRGDGGEDER